MKARPLTLENVAKRVARLEQWKELVTRVLTDYDARLSHLERPR